MLEVDLALCSVLRVVRQTRGMLNRRAHDQACAYAASLAQLRNELGASLSGLLLESELALRAATNDQAPRLRRVVELAGGLRQHLRPPATS